MQTADEKGMWQSGQGGFGLTEAVICVLVLSIGLLGLARLQAGLWKASEHLYSSTSAYLISRNILETRSLPFAPATPESDSVATVTANSTFNSTLEVAQAGALAEITVATRWQDPVGSHEIRLQVLKPASAALDSRWLLPDNRPP